MEVALLTSRLLMSENLILNVGDKLMLDTVRVEFLVRHKFRGFPTKMGVCI